MEDNFRENHIALFVGSLAGGGAERVMLNLAEYFISKEYRVDLVLSKYSGPLKSYLPSGIKVVELEKKSWVATGIYLCRLPPQNWWSIVNLVLVNSPSVFRRIHSFVEYLKDSRPNVVLSTLDAVNIVSLMAKSIAVVKTRFYVRQAIHFSSHTTEMNKYFDKNLMPNLLKTWYPIADKVVSVSKSMEHDFVINSGLENNLVTTIYNPLNLAKIEALSSESVDLPWLNDKKCPTLVAAGRLVEQKDFPTLIKAVRNISENEDIRLIILGAGPEWANLYALIKNLSVEEHVKLLGHQNNPYKYFARADLFVLSSIWEGMPNVLLEALACRCQIVSTNCPSGPNEILQNGKFGNLVPVGNVREMQEAISAAIKSPIDKDILSARANEFALEKIGKQYLSLLFSNL